MQIFHYCAEILKGTPLFTTCTDEDVRKNTKKKEGEKGSDDEEDEGAVYNDFDGMLDHLVHDSDLEEDYTCSSQQPVENNEHEVVEEVFEEPSVEEEHVDFYFLASDEADRKRWVKQHALFSDDKNAFDYKDKVRQLTQMSDKAWSALPISSEDLKRYDI